MLGNEWLTSGQGRPVDTENQRSIVSALADKYPVFAVSTIERWVTETMESFSSARVRSYIPVLVQRSVDATLTELARADGTSTDLLPVSKLTEPRRATIRPDLGLWPTSRTSRSVPNPFG